MSAPDSDSFKTYFYERFKLTNHWQAFEPVAKFLNTLKADQRFRLLFSVMCDPHDRPCKYQKVASGLMLKVDAGCPLSVVDAVTPLLDTIDLSIQEFPFFLAKRYGRDRVLSDLASIDISILSDHQRRRLDTLSYWTRGFTDERYEEVRKRWGSRIKG
jgi:hypothetical protein